MWGEGARGRRFKALKVPRYHRMTVSSTLCCWCEWFISSTKDEMRVTVDVAQFRRCIYTHTHLRDGGAQHHHPKIPSRSFGSTFTLALEFYNVWCAWIFEAAAHVHLTHSPYNVVLIAERAALSPSLSLSLAHSACICEYTPNITNQYMCA